jgi:hypothetical protein
MNIGWKRLAATVIGVVMLIDVQAGFAIIKGDIELLRVIADGYETNLAKLKTWAGGASIISSVSTGAAQGALRRQGKYRAEFLVNRDLRAVRWKWYSLEDTEYKAGQKHSSNLCPMFGMTKGDCDYVLFFLGYFVHGDGQPGVNRNLNIYPRDRWPRHFEGMAFDPVHILTKEIYPGLIKQIRYYHKLGGKMENSNGSVTREGDIVTVETDNDRGNYGRIITRFVFDLSKGCCLREFFNSSRISESHWKFDYEKIADVFVMKSVSHVRKDNRVTSERKATLTNNMVNGPAGEPEFSLGKIGLRPGDRIRDTRTNLTYIFGEDGATEADMPPKITESIMNKVLPGFQGIEIEFATQRAKGKMILVCFWDMEQRPSRHCIIQLAKQAEQLRQKGVMVVAVQASKVDENALNEWLKKYNVPFPVGMIQGDVEKTRFTWGVRSLPWLILTDRKHIVRAEGFAISELDQTVRLNTHTEEKSP